MFNGITERQIQDYIWHKRESWDELLDIPEIPNDELDVSPRFRTIELIRKIFLDRIKKNIQRLMTTQLFASEVPLEKNGASTIRADFLGYSGEGSGLCIVELKKSKKTEREVFTELMGYSGHLMSCFPGTSRQDILNILICPLESRIVKESILYSIIVENKPVCALIPILEINGDLSSLKLRLWMPTIDDLISYSGKIFSNQNFRSVVISCQFDKLWNSTDDHDEYKYIRTQSFNMLASYAAQLLEERGLIGFAQCAQVQDEASDKIPMPNFLTITVLNPIETAFVMKQVSEGEMSNLSSLPGVSGIDLSYFIQGLEKSREFDPKCCHYSELADSFDNHLWEIGLQAVELSLQNYPGRHISREGHGGIRLDHHFDIFNPSIYDEHDVYCSGFLREMMVCYVQRIFEVHSKNQNAMLATGELHWHTAHEMLKNKLFLVDFLRLVRRS